MDKAIIKKAEYTKSPCIKWNSFINIIAVSYDSLNELSPIQKIAHFVWIYSSEVLNGGHYQYLCNCPEYNHSEVVKALKSIGAHKQAELLQKAIELDESDPQYDDKIVKLDNDFNNCRPEIETELLEKYLDENESHFIEWID